MLILCCSDGRGRADLRPRINEALATSNSSATTPAAMPPRTATSIVIDESIEIKSVELVLGCCVAVKESLDVKVVVPTVVSAESVVVDGVVVVIVVVDVVID